VAWAGTVRASGLIARAAMPHSPIARALVPRGARFTQVPFSASEAGISGLRQSAGQVGLRTEG
jgi:hypothetical protein